MSQRPMRHISLRIVSVIAALVTIGSAAGAQLVPPFRTFDWLTHRGTTDRLGSNAGVTPVPPAKMGRTWVYPGTAQLNPEEEVDNSLLPAPMFPLDAGC